MNKDNLINKCAPGKKFTEGSCFTLENLKTIAIEYNKTHTDKIPLNINNKKELLRELNPRFEKKYGCNDQTCWLSSKVIKNINDRDIKYYTFRPKGPAKQYEWLSTSDIESVMKQYQYKHKDFKFLGAMPSDFDELPILGIHNLNFDTLKSNGKTKIGLIMIEPISTTEAQDPTDETV